MKAMAVSHSGPSEVLQLEQVATPAPKAHEVLIRIHATTAAPVDGGARSSKPDGASPFLRPGHPAIVIPGQDLAGEVEAIGRQVTRFRKGDPVVAWSGIRMGTYAEYICLPERGTLFLKPANMTYEEAATLPVSGLDTTYLLRRANIQRGERVLVNGAGGNMGTYAVQIAKVLGAEVTGVDHTTKLDMLRSIGADHVVDYTQEDFAQSGETYDVIFDVVGNRSLSEFLKRLRPGGRYLTAVPQFSQILRWQWIAWRSGKKVIIWVPRTAGRQAKDFAFLKHLVEEGSVKAIIDKCFSLGQAAEAHRYVKEGHKKGHVVITVIPNDTT
ncbi:MAG TPA: NAD(P)-dependent alcohol dehydrogenase [Anaerolineae bacterium]|nr:NAD(P)-dependent alcohol dehydrogenase [Anaerolineae bacterium]